MDDDAAVTAVTPDEAFSLLADGTRLDILRELGDADEPLSFSAVRDRVEVRDSGRFNYHLDRLAGHFVARSDDGYYLARPGRRVVEAVLSGALTDAPVLERTRIDVGCRYCGAPVEITWRAGSVEVYCTECPGTFARRGGDEPLAAEGGYVGRLPLPPAGLEGRDPEAVHRAAGIWGRLELLAMAAGVCPRCGGPLDEAATVCADHDASAGLCAACAGLHAVHFSVDCTNCIFEGGGDAGTRLLATTQLLSFLLDHGHNPIEPADTAALDRVIGDFDETVRSADPLRATFTFATDTESLALTVDDALDVVDSERRRT